MNLWLRGALWKAGLLTLPRRAIFLHIQKTAGSSFVRRAVMEYGPENVISHGDYLKMPMTEAGEKRFLSGHFGYVYAKHFMRGRFSFTFLRDPRERLLSFYNFCRSRDPNEYPVNALARDNSLEDFLKLGRYDAARPNPDMITRLWNNQVWLLAQGWYRPDDPGLGRERLRHILAIDPDELLMLALKHIRKFDYVGFLEDYEADSQAILRELGCRSTDALAAVNISPKRSKLTELPRSTLDLLDELTQLDRQLYEFSWSRFKSRGSIL